MTLPNFSSEISLSRKIPKARPSLHAIFRFQRAGLIVDRPNGPLRYCEWTDGSRFFFFFQNRDMEMGKLCSIGTRSQVR